jgi:hypothetical protein
MDRFITKRSTTAEEFSSKENADFLVDEILISINKYLANVKKHVLKNKAFLDLFNQIASTVFKHEKDRCSLKELNPIVINETMKHILKTPFPFVVDTSVQKPLQESPEPEPIVEDTFKKIGVETSKKTTIITHAQSSINQDNIVGLSLKSIRFDYLSDYNVGGLDNTITFNEKITEDKDLISADITVSLDPGNYTTLQLLEEVSFLMTSNSKVGNTYNLVFNDITSKIHVFSTKEPVRLDNTSSINKQIAAAEKGNSFGLVKAEGSLLGLLGFNSLGELKKSNHYKADSIFKLRKETTFDVRISGLYGDSLVGLFTVPVPCKTDTVSVFEEQKKFEEATVITDIVVEVPDTKSQDIEFVLELEVEFLST